MVWRQDLQSGSDLQRQGKWRLEKGSGREHLRTEMEYLHILVLVLKFYLKWDVFGEFYSFKV